MEIWHSGQSNRCVEATRTRVAGAVICKRPTFRHLAIEPDQVFKTSSGQRPSRMPCDWQVSAVRFREDVRLILTFIFSSIDNVAPIYVRSEIVVVTSCKCGTFPMITSSSLNKLEASIGSTEFFAPEILTSPSKGFPPVINCFSIFRTQTFHISRKPRFR